ncbi:hypothetical protein EAF00_005754 [Botryotinia globosa]|nr:hypothetical protein EAF00_005754 [Botryotinia globosa]
MFSYRNAQSTSTDLLSNSSYTFNFGPLFFTGILSSERPTVAALSASSSTYPAFPSISCLFKSTIVIGNVKL